MKKVIGGFFAFLVLLSLVYVGFKSYSYSDRFVQPVFTADTGVSFVSKVEKNSFFVLDTHGQWQESFLTGVNIGLGAPGSFPGEFAIGYETYFNWFTQIGEMGANSIRVYTPQSPDFYRALYDYNGLALTPLYLLQGVYMDESDILEYGDVFAPDSIAIRDMRKDIIDCINMIHGNATVAPERGKASGVYRWDVSKYVIGWILGIECETFLVEGTNNAHPEITSFEGDYLYTQNASPFEVFIAQMKELAIAYETEHYRFQRPVAFSNWPTTDPLNHPNEPFEDEDLVSINVEHILAKESFVPGFFASYHVYPYYPEFLNFPSGDPLIDANPYLAYLQSLTRFHTMPVIISEFGLPTSRGVTHINHLTGLDQGGHSEQQQGQGLVSMLDDIHRSGSMGGIVFAWMDEWFKKSWNTMDFDDPDARPKWLNAQSSEVNFGLVSFRAFPSIRIDGRDDDWAEAKALDKDRRLHADWDESFLYLHLDVDDFEHQRYFIPIDTIVGQGSAFSGDAAFERAADFVLVLDGKNETQLLIDPYYEPNYKLLGSKMFNEEELKSSRVTGTGVFILVRQVVSNELTMPLTGQEVPAQFWDTGKMMYGNADPQDENYDSRADFCAGDGFVEIRIPWMLLNFADPSSGKILDSFQKQEGITHTTIREIYVGLGEAEDGQFIRMHPYELPAWSGFEYSQRLKRSYDILRDTLPRYATYPVIPDEQRDSALRMRDTRLNLIRFEQRLPHVDLLIYLLAFSLLLVLYLYLFLVVINLRMSAAAIKRERETQHLRSIMSLPGKAIERKLHTHYMCTPKGMEMLSLFLLEKPTGENKTTLLKVLSGERQIKCLRRHMRSKDVMVKILAIRLVGLLRLNRLKDDVLSVMENHLDNVELQYSGFLALSIMGIRGSLVKQLMRPEATKMLAFRSLKEILKAYTGNKALLYKDLLYAEDVYLRRIVVKSIGDERIHELAGRLMPMLKTDDINLRCDLIRTLGQLGYAPAGSAIVHAFGSQNWVERSTAVTALASIDAPLYWSLLLQGLKDKEWWVRCNSSRELSRRFPAQKLEEAIPLLNDRFAAETLVYAMEENTLMKQSEADT